MMSPAACNSDECLRRFIGWATVQQVSGVLMSIVPKLGRRVWCTWRHVYMELPARLGGQAGRSWGSAVLGSTMYVSWQPCMIGGLPHFLRRFQPVYVLEPNEKDTLAILRGLSERYERHHRCVYEPEALEAAVHLSHKYIADRFLPDKVGCRRGAVVWSLLLCRC